MAPHSTELEARIAAGRAAWPAIPLDEQEFARHLRALAADEALPPIEHAGDLWLARACELGVQGAVAAFERAHRPIIERAAARVDRSLVDEATQAVLVSLLVRDSDEPPRVSAYGGRASLRAWVATVAARTASKLRRRRGDQPHDSVAGVADAIAGVEPELALARARYAPEVGDALRAALASLDARQVVLLRLHHAKGWSVDRIGEAYRVGRSTAARWVAAARAAILDETKRILHARFQLTASELQSLFAAVQGELDVSLVRWLDEG